MFIFFCSKKRLSQKKSKIIEVEKQALQENEEKQIDYEEQVHNFF